MIRAHGLRSLAFAGLALGTGAASGCARPCTGSDCGAGGLGGAPICYDLDWTKDDTQVFVDGCAVEYAANPAGAPVAWEPCEGAQPCEVLWVAGRAGFFRTLGYGAGAGGEPLLLFRSGGEVSLDDCELVSNGLVFLLEGEAARVVSGRCLESAEFEGPRFTLLGSWVFPLVFATAGELHSQSVGGWVDEPRPRLLAPTVTTQQSWDRESSAGPYLARATNGSLVLRPWEEPSELVAYDPSLDPDLAQVTRAAVIPVELPGDTAIFFHVDSQGTRGVYLWTAASGAVPLLRWPGTSRAASGFATDGSMMTWLEREGPNGVPVLRRAPFTTDPAALVPEDVGSLGKVLDDDAWTQPWAIGCGFTHGGGRLWRLADGSAFELDARPIGISCESLYVQAADRVLRYPMSGFL